MSIRTLPADIRFRSEIRPDASWCGLRFEGRTVNPVTSMISEDESHYLHWLAREYYRGQGEIVDAGCLLGGSTVSLASGLAANSHVAVKQGRIHSYDLFQFCEGFRGHVLPSDTALREGDSLLPIYLRNTQAYRDYIRVEPGDIATKSWNDGPIEILFIDVAKSWEIHHHLMREFFSRLIPGRSIVVHQDWFHFGCWWIHLTMQHLEEYFEVTEFPQGATLSFRLLKRIPDSLLQKDYRNFTPEEVESLMDRVVGRAEGTLRSALLAAKASALAERRLFDKAVATVREARRVEPWDDRSLFDVVHAEAMIPGDLAVPEIADASTLVAASRSYLVSRVRNGFSAIPRNDPGCETRTRRKGAISGRSLEAITVAIGENVIPVPPTMLLVGSHKDVNLVWYAGRMWGLPVRLGHVDLANPQDRSRPGILCGRSSRDVIDQIDISQIDGGSPPIAGPHAVPARRPWLSRLFGR